jgi:hypothetical protein
MMNDEYLWNKTGNDAEIEGLENELKAFRYQETEAPPVSVKAPVLLEKRLKGFLRLGFAFALAAGVVVALSGAWFLFSGNGSIGERGSVSAVQPLNEPLADIPDTNIEPPIEIAKPVRNREFVKIRHTNRIEVRTVRTIARKLPNEHAPATLTAEEKYAYDQLMLALSITSSKLKIVKDKVSQIDEQNAVIEK